MTVLDLDYYARLKKDYITHGSLFVDFDFDNTVFDYHNTGVDYSPIIDLLKRCQFLGFKLILFTAREGVRLSEAIEHLDQVGVTPNMINVNPFMETRKPYYNILLDDRSGLLESYTQLKQLVDAIQNGNL